MTKPGIEDRYTKLQQPAILEEMRHQFRKLNLFMVLMWRLGLGPLFGWFPDTWGQILVLHHIGRRSGNVFQSPVNFTEVDGRLFCVAAFGQGSDWYKNLMAHPRVEAWLPDSRWVIDVRDASDSPDRLALIRQVLMASGFAAPAMGLHPARMSDEELREATADYRLLELDRVEPIEANPADLRWAWLVPLAMIIVVRLRRGRS